MSESESKKRRSKTKVPASPFNPVKLELALVLVVGVSVFLAVPRLVESESAQLAVLAGYGALGAGWIAVRTRRILRRLRQGGEF